MPEKAKKKARVGKAKAACVPLIPIGEIVFFSFFFPFF
jgi:hypothetical protein